MPLSPSVNLNAHFNLREIAEIGNSKFCGNSKCTRNMFAEGFELLMSAIDTIWRN